MNTTIKAAIVKIAIEQYIQGINEFPGYIDASDYFLEPTEVFDVEKYASIEDAEKELRRVVELEQQERSEYGFKALKKLVKMHLSTATN